LAAFPQEAKDLLLASLYVEDIEFLNTIVARLRNIARTGRYATGSDFYLPSKKLVG